MVPIGKKPNSAASVAADKNAAVSQTQAAYKGYLTAYANGTSNYINSSGYFTASLGAQLDYDFFAPQAL